MDLFFGPSRQAELTSFYFSHSTVPASATFHDNGTIYSIPTLTSRRRRRFDICDAHHSNSRPVKSNTNGRPGPALLFSLPFTGIAFRPSLLH